MGTQIFKCFVFEGTEGGWITTGHVDEVSSLDLQTQKEINVEYGLLLKQIREARNI